MSTEGSTTNGQAPVEQTTNTGTEQMPLPGPETNLSPLETAAQMLMENDNGNDTQETGQQEETETTETAADILSDVQAPEASEQAEPEKSGAERLADLVEELGTSFETVYKDMKVPVANGREVTLGELKDHYQSREALLSEVVESREALEAQRADNLRERQSIEMLMPHVASVPEETKQQVREQYETALQRETSSLQAALPQLKDQNAFGAFRDDFVEYMGQFGFKPSELTIADHRLILALNEGMELKKQFATMRDRLKPAAKSPVRKVAKPVDKQQSRASGKHDRQGDINQVMRLIGG